MLTEDQIGRRVRKLRLDRGFSQRQVAVEAGLTKSYLSKIENSDSAPPVSTLLTLARALGVTMEAFFSEKDPDTVYTLLKKGQRQTMARAGTEFGYSYEPLAPKFPGRLMEPFILRIPPNAETKKDFQHSGHEFFMVMEGRVQFKIGEEELIMEKGDAIYFDASVPHSGKSLDGKPFVCLMVICSGGTGQKSTDHMA